MSPSCWTGSVPVPGGSVNELAYQCLNKALAWPTEWILSGQKQGGPEKLGCFYLETPGQPCAEPGRGLPDKRLVYPHPTRAPDHLKRRLEGRSDDHP